MSPGKWPRVRIADLTTKVGSGSTPRGGNAAYKQSGTPLIRSMNVVFFGFKRDGLAFIDDAQADLLKGVTVRANDVLLNITGASIGRVTLAPEDLAGARVNQHVCIIRPTSALDARFLCAFLSGPEMQSAINLENFGVTRQALTKEQILGFEIPLPPLPEQKRIADKLDTLLARVDTCRNRLARVPAILKRFRQSVLAAATSGELTQDWREERGLDPLLTTTLGEVLRVSSGKFLPAKEMAPGGTIPVFGGNGINGYHDKANVEEETIVIGRVGFYCGSVHLTPPLAWVTDNALIVRYDPIQTSRRFLSYALQAVDLRANDSSTAQPVISGAKIYPTPIAIPNLLEQSEIVRRVETLFALADQLEAHYTTARNHIDRLTPALLAKAFRGELLKCRSQI